MSKGTRVALAWMAATSVVALPLVAAAAGATFKNPIQAESISALLAALLEFFVRVATVVCVLYIVWSGFLFVKAQGNEEELKKAKRAFFYALIGTLLMLGAQVISTAISNTINQISGTRAQPQQQRQPLRQQPQQPQPQPQRLQPLTMPLTMNHAETRRLSGNLSV